MVTCVVTGFSINAAFYGVAFLLGLYFQQVLGEPAITAGLLFLPMTGLLAVANLVSARVAARWGHHVPVRAGLCVGALGMLLLLRDHAGGDGSNIRIINCNPDVKKILAISNFEQLFNIQ